MGIGGKVAEFNDSNNLNDSYDDNDSDVLNIKSYIADMIRQRNVATNNNVNSEEKRNNESSYREDNDSIFSKINNKLSKQKDEDLEIQTNLIEVNSVPVNKTKQPQSKSFKYFNNKKYQLYKTEICRSHSEVGYCKYGNKCQFAHDISELRGVNRHPRYKTETCRTFWEEGSCPYGKRCCFIHIPNNTTKDSIQDLTSQDLPTSTPIVENMLTIDNYNDIVYSDESRKLENDFLFVIPTKNNMIEFEEMNDSTSLDLNEIDLSDIDIEVDRINKKRPSIDQYEIDELYVNSLFVQEQKPFWSTNEANIWSENSLFYIKGLNRFSK